MTCRVWSRWSVLVSLGVLGVSGCPGPTIAPPVVPDPPGRTSIVPDFIAEHGPCVERFDAGADGVFEQVRHITIDEEGRTVRTELQVDGVQFSAELFLRREDGLIHDSENFLTDETFLPVQYGNSHFFYEGTRLVRELFEGSDGRFLVQVRQYIYEGDLLTRIETNGLIPDIPDGTAEFSYDGDVLVEQRNDTGNDGVDETFTFEHQPDGDLVLTSTFIRPEGTTVVVSRFDPFSTLLRREIDTGDDGVIDNVAVARVTDGRLVGYDIDPDGSGTFSVRQDLLVDEVAKTLIVTNLTDGVVTSVGDREYACFDATVDRGGCPSPQSFSEAFGCSHFRLAPAMQNARGSAIVAVEGTSILATGGFASYVQGIIYGALDVVDVDEPAAGDSFEAPFDDDAGMLAGFDNGDGSVSLFGGIREGVVGTVGMRVAIDGSTTTTFNDLLPKFAHQAVRLADNTVVLVGGFGGGGEGVAQLINEDGFERRFSADVAPADGTLTVAGGVAFYVGGDDGSAGRVPSDKVVAVDATGIVLGNLPQPRTDHVAVARDQELLIIGGRDTTGATASVLVVRFNDVDRTMAFSPGPDLPLPLMTPAVTILPDGRVYVVGGFSAPNVPSALTFVLDGDQWLAGPSLQVARGQARAVVLDDGRVVVVGGSQYFGSSTAAVEVLEIGAGQQ